MLRACLAAAVVLSGVLVGCVIFTGGTNGFTAAEAGTGAGCKAPSDCSPGQLCCADLEGGVPSTTCQTSCPAPLQLCSAASDCEGGICLTQSCPIDAGPIISSVTVSTCGVVSECTQ